jgi:hypothetical protein
VHITLFNDGIPANNYDHGIIEYTLPWSIETFNALMRHASENVSLSFHKDGANTAVGAQSVEQFITEDVETAIKREIEFTTRKNKPSISMDDWDEYQKYRAEKHAKDSDGVQYG